MEKAHEKVIGVTAVMGAFLNLVMDVQTLSGKNEAGHVWLHTDMAQKNCISDWVSF